MLLNNYNQEDYRVRITVIDNWDEILRYVPEFLYSELTSSQRKTLISNHCEGVSVIYVDLVYINFNTKSVEDRLSIIVSDSTLLETLEILMAHSQMENKKEFYNALTIICNSIVNYKG